VTRSPGKRRRGLSKAELRALGATPSLLARRIDADGRSTLEQISPESGARLAKLDFARRFTEVDDVSRPSEGSV
jgi:hypothetical protein